MPKVLNEHHLSKQYPPNAVYVGHPSKRGNPFAMPNHSDRAEVIRKYRIRLLGSPRLLDQIHELEEKDLVCWCAPLPYHADVLLELANSPKTPPFTRLP